MKVKTPGSDAIVFPLDVPEPEAAEALVDRLAGSVGVFKVGLELFVRCGPMILASIHKHGAESIFLDLKLHDIPTTVQRAMERIADLGVRFATVHCGESPRMLEAAVDGSGGRVQVLAVTVLTSVGAADLRQAGFMDRLAADPAELVLARAEAARDAGCDGVVCSAQEAAAIKQRLGAGFLAVTPGIRPDWEGTGHDDQHRVTTPAEAIRSGADYLVVGRPIRDAPDPRAAALRLAEEIEQARG